MNEALLTVIYEHLNFPPLTSINDYSVNMRARLHVFRRFNFVHTLRYSSLLYGEIKN
jgi:hypothetical protein